MCCTCGLKLWRLREGWWKVFAGLCVAELLLQFTVRQLWEHPRWGESTAMATGISMGGMSPQMLVYLPWWAPVLLWLAVRDVQSGALP